MMHNKLLQSCSIRWSRLPIVFVGPSRCRILKVTRGDFHLGWTKVSDSPRFVVITIIKLRSDAWLDRRGALLSSFTRQLLRDCIQDVSQICQLTSLTKKTRHKVIRCFAVLFCYCILTIIPLLYSHILVGRPSATLPHLDDIRRLVSPY